MRWPDLEILPGMMATFIVTLFSSGNCDGLSKYLRPKMEATRGGATDRRLVPITLLPTDPKYCVSVDDIHEEVKKQDNGESARRF